MRKYSPGGSRFRLHQGLLLMSMMMTTVASAQMPGSVYRIVSTNTKKAMSVDKQHNANSPIKMVTTSEDDKDQMWAVISRGNENGVGLMNLASRLSIDMALGAEGDTKGNLLQWKPNLRNPNQVFEIKSPGIAGSAMQLLCADSPELVVTEAADGSLQMLNDLTSTSTYFEFTEVISADKNTVPLPYSTYQIQPVKSQGVLSNGNNNENNAPIIVETPDEKAFGQMWQLDIPVYQGGTTAWYMLYNATCGKCIDCAFESGKAPLQWTQDKNANQPNWNQMFELLPVEGKDGTYQLKVGKNVGNKWSPRLEYYYLAVNHKDEVYTTQEAQSEDTHFRFIRVKDTNLPQGIFWQDETVFQENKEPGHASYIPYQSTQAMRADANYAKPWLDPKNSSKWLDLNGTWKLQWTVLKDDYVMPQEDFYGDQVDATAWSDVTVPGCLEMQGFGKPYYINVDYAFTDNPPYIRMKNGLDNSVGSYRRNFTLPEGWENERVLLHFDGIYSCAYVWVNGQYVGYTEGANMDAEFDVTKYVRQGDNNVSVRTIRWTDASYLEGQDMWHMSGIYRDVYMVAVPHIFVRDHHIHSNLAEDATSGTLAVNLTLDNRDKLEANKTYEVRLLSPNGETLATKEANVAFTSADKEKKVTLDFGQLTDLKPWTADVPTLYTVEVVQKDDKGQEESTLATKYGFCRADIVNSQFRINGKRTLLRGVNTQDTHPLMGRTMDNETMWKDLVMMKQANVNIVRTSHYPRSAKMNAMMDYLGLYVMDEADVEFHRNWSDAGNIHTSPSWRAPIVDRVERMVLRDRNHPSIVSWSLGNESDGGINHQHSYDAARKLDPRPIHYEGATRAQTSPTDMHSVMYPDVYSVENQIDRMGKPYFMCEYAHSMGHSLGNLQEYWDVMEKSTNGMGGCVWDWVDQAIVDYNDIKNNVLTVNGFNKYRNGHDYGGPHQGNFVNNGIITADRGITGKLAELRRVYQQVAFSMPAKDTKTVVLNNKYEQLNLEGMLLEWELLCNGEKVQNGSEKLTSFPVGTQKEVQIPYSIDGDGEYLLNVAVALPQATEWADKGHKIAASQFALTSRPALPTITPAPENPLQLSQSGQDYTINGKNISMTISTTDGIKQWTMGGMDVIPANDKGETAPAYNNYRWIENDAPYGTDPHYDTSNGISNRTFQVKTAEDGSGQILITEKGTGNKCDYVFTYTVHTDGTVDMDAAYTVKASNLRRIGMQMQFNPELNMTQYYARGPLDNTIDRKQGSDLGIYSLPVSKFHVDYVRPQTSGDRQDLRWITLYNAEGKGIRVETEGQVNLSVDNYTDELMHTYLHQWEMPASDKIYANFDYAQLGIGNGSCGAGVMNKYILPKSGTYKYRLRFTPADNVDTGITDLPCLEDIDGDNADAPVYNLQGQLVGNTSCSSALPRGIYIARGKKFVVK